MAEMIASLSHIIEQAAISFAWLLITVFPFLPETLVEHPETIMIVIGFGGQFLFAMRFIIQWITSEREQKSVIPYCFLVFFHWWRGSSVALCHMAARPGDYLWAGAWIVYLFAQSVFCITRTPHQHI
jgi:hypothetical protein